MSITILYTFRDRDIDRIKNSLDSLANQSLQNFDVIFIDYGSNKMLASQVQKLLLDYNFVSYKYVFTAEQPWNKSKALNYALRNFVEKDYFFVADIDMIFNQKFSSVLAQLIIEKPLENVFFKVGFLSKFQKLENKEYQDLKIHFESTSGATGLTLFHTNSLKKLNGFDEFYHFWGSEDTDAHVRLQNIGCEVSFYDTEILMLHQWHPSYRSKEQKILSNDLQLSRVVQLNHQHLMDAIVHKRSVINDENWGILISELEYKLLQNPRQRIKITNRKPEIDHFLCYTLKQKIDNITEYIFHLDIEQGTLKQKIKKILRKKIPNYYSLKEINDLLLFHLIANPQLKKYSYKIAPDLKSISLVF